MLYATPPCPDPILEDGVSNAIYLEQPRLVNKCGVWGRGHFQWYPPWIAFQPPWPPFQTAVSGPPPTDGLCATDATAFSLAHFRSAAVHRGCSRRCSCRADLNCPVPHAAAPFRALTLLSRGGFSGARSRTTVQCALVVLGCGGVERVSRGGCVPCHDCPGPRPAPPCGAPCAPPSMSLSERGHGQGKGAESPHGCARRGTGLCTSVWPSRTRPPELCGRYCGGGTGPTKRCSPQVSGPGCR